ncbi:MAG: DUF4097 domain-containing protein [Clostridia bacterium]|nr:DUF4097 domain-containing protein [Clostridia bacterium]
MKNKGLIITLIILLSIIIFFLVMFLVSCLRNKTNFISGLISFGSKSTNVIFDEQFELKDIKNIEIKQDAGDIIFKETANDYIQVVIYGKNEKDAQVDLSDGKLNIDCTHKENFQFFNFGGMKTDIIVYIPSNYSNEIKIENDYGKCEMIDLENAIVNIKSDAGDIELGKVKNVTIKCNCGDIEISEILNKCDIKADCGNIKIDKISIQENSTIKSDLGDVYINSTNDIYIDTDVDLGKTKINKNNRKAEITLEINCDCGNITINN